MYIAKAFLAIGALGFVTGGCAVKNIRSQGPDIPNAGKPKIELRCSPKIGMGAAFGPVQFVAFLSVKNPGEKYWCPAVEWLLDGQKTSAHESDCDPYATVVAEQGKEPEVWSEPAKYFGLLEGEHTIAAELTMSGRTIGKAECGVIAR